MKSISWVKFPKDRTQRTDSIVFARCARHALETPVQLAYIPATITHFVKLAIARFVKAFVLPMLTPDPGLSQFKIHLIHNILSSPNQYIPESAICQGVIL